VRLSDLYAPAFSAGLRILEDVRTGANRRDPVDQVQASLGALLDQIEQRARAAGRRDQDIRDASFAVVAWLDEVVAADPEWFGFDARPIQVTRFDSYQAGEEFYVRLMQLRADQDEVRELYFTALVLGFLGKYALDPESNELRALIATQARQLPIKPVSPGVLGEEKLTPQPYNVALPTSRRLPSNRDRWLVRTGIALAVLVPVGVYLYLLAQAPPTVPNEAPPSVPAPVAESAPTQPKPATDVAAVVREHLGRVACSRLRGNVNGGDVALSGFAASDEDVRQVRADLLKLDGVTGVKSDDVVLLPKPLCEVAEVVDAYATAPQLRLSMKGGQFKAAIGDAVVVEGEAPAFDGYVYVDIYGPDGGVGHMTDSAPDKALKVRASAKFSAGDGDVFSGAHRWTVEPPGGAHLLVLTASRTPLFKEARPLGEDFHKYLDVLGPALRAADKPVVRYVVLQLGS
jgi:type IV/VI secretion system ImpK/VasF family protein